MTRRHIFLRAFRKATRPIFDFLNIDDITYEKILRRSDLQWIGSDHGGWVVSKDLLNEDSVCYCVGCGEDITFDLGLIDEFDCHVYGFDPTPRAIKHVREHAKEYGKYHFSEVGLWDKEDTIKFFGPRNYKHVSHSALNLQQTEQFFEARVDRLVNIMRRNKHTKLDLLKLDIEGAEYKVAASIIEDGVDVRILCIEYDEYFNSLDQNYKIRIKNSVNSIMEFGYSLVCAQGSGNYTFIKNA
ncbi:MAG: FkbM family methyltransferase [Pyrinomonadaceae bacterium]